MVKPVWSRRFVSIVVLAVVFGIAYGMTWSFIKQAWLRNVDWWVQLTIFVAAFTVFYYTITKRRSRSKIWDKSGVVK